MVKRWRSLLFWLLVVELASVILFCALLCVGEESRLTLLALYAPRQPLAVAALAGVVLAPLTRRRVRLLAGMHVAAALVVVFPVMGFTISGSHTAEKPIRLATYNVFFGKGGRPQLVSELASMPADILAIEAGYGSLGKQLEEALPGRNVRQDGELLCVSKFPIRAFEVPPPLPDGTPSMYVKCVVDTPQGALRVYVVHPYSPRHALFRDVEADKNIAQREGQIAAAIAAARSDVPPVVIAGDTNLPVMSALARRYFAGFTDAFADTGLGFGFTFPAKRPWMRIDRVLGTPGVRFVDASVSRRGVSDHLALQVELELVP